MDIRSMSLEELKRKMEEMGEKEFRAGQIYRWLHERMAESYSEMTDLSKATRKKLENQEPLRNLEPIRMQESSQDGTRKYLFRLFDGNLVESVWMKYHHGNSVCISSQVGCRMGCRFCASTLDGLERNLLPSEMLEQIYAIIRCTGERVSNIVVMGTGEPLDNYENLIRFLELISGPQGQNISQRNITVSTCGIVPRIRQLAEEKLQITLAISLHSAIEEKRRQLMPVANRYKLEELIDSCRYYFTKTGRRITFEYALVAGQNDGNEDARALVSRVKGLNCHINLIPVNPIEEREYRQSGRERIEAFKNYLEKNQINVTIRREMGRDIDGACGQLRRRHIMKEESVNMQIG